MYQNTREEKRLFSACRAGDLETMKLFSRHVNAKDQSYYSFGPLHYAAGFVRSVTATCTQHVFLVIMYVHIYSYMYMYTQWSVCFVLYIKSIFLPYFLPKVYVYM